MFDTASYSRELAKLVQLSQSNEFLTTKDITNIFGKDIEETLLDEIEKYLDTLGIDYFKDNNFTIYEEVCHDAMDEGFDEHKKKKSYSDSTKEYLNDISKIPLLTATDEYDLGIIIQRGNKAEKKLTNLKEKNEESIKKLKQIAMNGIAARNALTEANLRLVVSIAKHYTNRGIPFMDLVQEGNLGLMKAVYKFDPLKGFRFSTYATFWIRQAISRAIADQGRIVRIPVHMIDAVNQLLKKQQELTLELKRTPTNDELSKALDISLDKVEFIKEISQDSLSLDDSISDDATMSDLIADTSAISPYEYAKNVIYKEKMDKLLATLDDREEQIVRLRYGFVDNIVHTLEEVGSVYGITRERVRQIEIKAIRRLRHPSRLNILFKDS